MTDTITHLLTQALTQSLKDALTPIVREAVTEALATMPPKALADETQAEDTSPLLERIKALEEQVADLESQMSDKADTNDIEQAVIDAIDNGSFSIEFRG